MFIDDITVRIIAGNGGKGASVFNKTLRTLGPAGGSGGEGGNVYVEGVSDLAALRQFRYRKEFSAEDGENGKGQLHDGHKGKDLILKVPTGTVIHNLTNKGGAVIHKIGQRILIAKGGTGGRGNYHFRSSTNTSPREFEEGGKGEKFTIRFELKLIADVGFVGLPNVGKSSLLNELTNAKSRVANYHFTTLEPNLGTYYDLILADIPGLIEGSSSGKGLGIKFLRHIERTQIIFHFISAESESPLRDYKTIRKELGTYSKALLLKDEHIFLTKHDLVTPAEMKKKLTILKKIDPKAMAISIYDLDSMKHVMKLLNKIKDEKKV